MVINGPTPIMSIMFSEVALHNPMPRIRPGEDNSAFSGEPMCRLDEAPALVRVVENFTGNWALATGYCFSCPAFKIFTNNRTAPGTPAGNCRKNAYPV